MEDAEFNEGNNNHHHHHHHHINNVDSDNKELARENIRDGTTKESFLSLTSETEKAMVRLFSPSPTCSINDISTTRSNGSGGGSSALYAAAKESKVVIERKLLCVNTRMDYFKYVLSSDCYDADEKKKVKED